MIEESPGIVGYLTSSHVEPLRYSGWRGVLQTLSRRMPESTVQRARGAATVASHPRSRARLAALAQDGPLRLHLGAGGLPLDGWVDIDRIGVPADVYWDLRFPLPLPDGSVEAIQHSHTLEHLDPRFGVQLHQECFRLLRSGGVLRIAVPDAELVMRRYLDRSPDLGTAAPTPLLAAARTLTGYGHVTMWDFETLAGALREIGFVVERSGYREGRLQPSPDAAGREGESLYIEAIRP